jgi:hypothetical protein
MFMRFERVGDDAEDLQLLFGLKGNRLIAGIMRQSSEPDASVALSP